MNILFAHWGETPLRGSERILLSMSSGLYQRGHGVHVICNQQVLASAIDQHCESVVVFQRSASSFNRRLVEFVRLIVSTIHIVKKNKIDIIVSNNLGTSRWASLVSMITGCRFVCYLHTNYLPRARFASLAHLSDAMIGVSDFVLEGFLEDGYKRDKIFRIWNGVEVQDPFESKSEIRKSLEIPENAVVALSVGAFVPFKRFDMFLQVSSLLSQKHHCYIAMICGDGPLRMMLETQYSESNVKFLGWKNEVARYIKAADFIVSCSNREAFGLSIIEAAALGRPAIVANRGGQVEIVEDGVSGTHFEADSMESCYSKIEQMILSPNLYFVQGLNARDAYNKNFTVDVMVENIERCLIQIDESRFDDHSRWAKILRLVACSRRLFIVRLQSF